MNLWVFGELLWHVDPVVTLIETLIGHLNVKKHWYMENDILELLPFRPLILSLLSELPVLAMTHEDPNPSVLSSSAVYCEDIKLISI